MTRKAIMSLTKDKLREVDKINEISFNINGGQNMEQNDWFEKNKDFFQESN